MSRLGWRRGLMEEVTQADKVQKENSTSVASNAHGEKYRKPKPTKPKPFRFRTDERGMFKEATLEKKVHAPLKEITLIRTPGAKSTSKHQNVIQAKHWSSWSYLEEQRRMGFLVLHEVCVLDGHPSCLRRRKFDVTIFNFPHAGHYSWLSEKYSEFIDYRHRP
ncbi:uncharacterized protein LOC125473207 isoform X2 [Pyrus x bretschneideri]|uniref:uncharacterized protein LOC125473207 isoform X2 n=1 Tax=Pyrus x bretschneideri TaxID=225117 RepID=UPI002030F6E0|nr:uncharacterized protein LOC125473207 isoform X2 [Pyrus x bretschneideri]